MPGGYDVVMATSVAGEKGACHVRVLRCEGRGASICVGLVLLAAAGVLGGCEVEMAYLDAGGSHDADFEVLEVAGRWQVVHSTRGDCPTELLTHPFEGVSDWQLEGRALRIAPVASGEALTVEAISPGTFVHAARVAGWGCFLEERLTLEVTRLEGRMMQGSFEFAYRRAEGERCSFMQDVPVACLQRLEWEAFRR